MTPKLLTKKLLSAKKALDNLEKRKEECVNAQNKMDDEFLSTDLTSNRKYQKLIDLDFELAEKIDEAKKNVANITARLRRAEKKKEAINETSKTNPLETIASFLGENSGLKSNQTLKA